MEKRRNWKVRFYDKKNKIIDSFIIENRLEHEASKEAEIEVDKNSKIDDWTMMEIKKKSRLKKVF